MTAALAPRPAAVAGEIGESVEQRRWIQSVIVGVEQSRHEIVRVQRQGYRMRERATGSEANRVGMSVGAPLPGVLPVRSRHRSHRHNNRGDS